MASKGIWETVYFMSQGGFIKIGHTTTEINRRMKSYTTHSLEETVLLGFLHGDRSVELAMHRRFSDYRVKGEWFRDEGDLARFIIDELPALQEVTRVSRLDELRRNMEAGTQELPREVPPPGKTKQKRPGRPLISRGGKVFTKRGKRVLAMKAGDYFVDA